MDDFGFGGNCGTSGYGGGSGTAQYYPADASTVDDNVMTYVSDLTRFKKISLGYKSLNAIDTENNLWTYNPLTNKGTIFIKIGY